MNLSALPELLIAWLKGQGTASLQAGRSQEPSATSFKPGQHYDGQVLENLANGRSLVKVGQETLDMALPGRQVRPGETLRLTFLHAGPRPTFLLDQAVVAAPQPVRLSEAAQQVSVLIRYAQGPSPPQGVGTSATTGTPAMPPAAVQAGALPSASVQRPIVGDVSLLLNPANPASNLSAAVASRTALPALAMAGQAVDGMRAAIAAGTQLATQGVGQAALASQAVLPQRLRQVVRESGLFYESHLARWSRGELSLQDILREPQARLGRAEQAAGLPELARMPEEAARLAGRQLMMLEGGPFIWQGQVWPGQWIQWRLEEQASDQAATGEAAQWRTELKLTLPRLGEVSAELSLSAEGLRLLIEAGSDALAEVREALPLLAERLSAAGLKVQGLSARTIESDDRKSAA